MQGLGIPEKTGIKLYGSGPGLVLVRLMEENPATPRVSRIQGVHSRKLTWKPKKGPIKTTVLLNGDYMGFHVSLGECRVWSLRVAGLGFKALGMKLSQTIAEPRESLFCGLGFRV